jgi:hypothetical protein
MALVLATQWDDGKYFLPKSEKLKEGWAEGRGEKKGEMALILTNLSYSH